MPPSTTPSKSYKSAPGDDIRLAITDISRSANQRIAVSALTIVLILLIVSVSLTDYLGFSRGWSFFSKLVSGQSVTDSTVTAEDIYNNLLPLFRDYDELENHSKVADARISSAQAYVALVEQFLTSSASAVATGTELYPTFVSSIDALRPSDAYVSDCSRNYSHFIVEDSYSYSGDRTNPVTITPLFRYCQYDADDVSDERVSLPSISVTTPDGVDDLHSILLQSVNNSDLRIGLNRMKSAFSNEVNKLTTLKENSSEATDEAKDRISAAIAQYIALNKVDIGQDVSFIVSRALLLLTLISLAATSLKVILNEIRFSNRMNEIRIASGYSLLHSNPSILSSLYKSLTRDGEIGKSDAEAGLGSRDLKELLDTALKSLASGDRKP